MVFTTDGENIVAEGVLSTYDSSYFVDAINNMKAKKPGKKVTMLVNSPGGSINAGMAIAQLVNFQEKNIVIIGFGAISSAATYIAAMAERFYLYENSQMLIHPARRLPENGVSIADAEAIKIDLERIQNVVADMYAKKVQSNGKLINSNFEETKKYFLNLMEKDNYLSDKKALELGIIDGIIPQNGSKIIKSVNTESTATNINLDSEYLGIIADVQKDVRGYKPSKEVAEGYQNLAISLPTSDREKFETTFINQKNEPKKMGFFEKVKGFFGTATNEELKELGLTKAETENKESNDTKAAEEAKKLAADQKKKEEEAKAAEADTLNSLKDQVLAIQTKMEAENKAKDEALKKLETENKAAADKLAEVEKQLKLKESELAAHTKPSSNPGANGTENKGGEQQKKNEHADLLKDLIVNVAGDMKSVKDA